MPLLLVLTNDPAGANNFQRPTFQANANMCNFTPPTYFSRLPHTSQYVPTCFTSATYNTFLLTCIYVDHMHQTPVTFPSYDQSYSNPFSSSHLTTYPSKHPSFAYDYHTLDWQADSNWETTMAKTT